MTASRIKNSFASVLLTGALAASPIASLAQYGPPPSYSIQYADQQAPPAGMQQDAAAQYGAPQGQYGAPQGQYGAPQGQYGAPQDQYGAPQGHTAHRRALSKLRRQSPTISNPKPPATATSGRPATGPGQVMATSGFEGPGFSRPTPEHSGLPATGALATMATSGTPAIGAPTSATTVASTTASVTSA